MSETNPSVAGPAFRKVALLLIDFQQKDRRFFTYECGPLAEGIARTVSVIGAARDAQIPIILVSGRLSREVFPEISEAAGACDLRLFKRGISAFKEPDLETMLNALDITTVVMCGWVRHICVLASASDALKLGFSVMTSDEVLFGDRGVPNLVARRTSLEFFEKNCTLFDSTGGLIDGMKRENGLRGI